MKLQNALHLAGVLFALALPALPQAALAQQFGVFVAEERPYPYTDLPGVTPPEEREARDQVVCSRSYDEDERRRWGELKQPVYNCTQNGMTFSGRTAPISREREMRGLPR